MLNQTQLSRYHVLRAQGVHAARAHAAALQWTVPEYDVTDTGIRFQVDKLDVLVSVERDVDPDLSYAGTFSNEWNIGAVELKATDGYRYFHPAQTESEHVVGLRNIGFGRHDAAAMAASYVQEDLLIAKGEIFPSYVVSVTVLLKGIELGHAALGGVTLERDGWTHEGLASWLAGDGLANEALASARKNLAELVESI